MIVNNYTESGFVNYTQCTFWDNLGTSVTQSNGSSGSNGTAILITNVSRQAVRFKLTFYAVCTMSFLFWT